MEDDAYADVDWGGGRGAVMAWAVEGWRGCLGWLVGWLACLFWLVGRLCRGVKMFYNSVVLLIYLFIGLLIQMECLLHGPYKRFVPD